MFPLPPLTDEQRSVIDRVATLSRERFAPRAARYDADSTFPYENYADLHAAGLFALTVPREYGGVGADPVTYVHALREIAKGCSATALTFNMHSTVTTFVAALGTEEQKRRYFGEVVGRGARIASITSEPEQSFRDKFVLNTVFHPTDGGGLPGGGGEAVLLARRRGRLLLHHRHPGGQDQRARRRDLRDDPGARRGGEDRGHLERHRHARHDQPYDPVRLRGRPGPTWSGSPAST